MAMMLACEHGGVTVGSSLSARECLCDPHYTGVLCETLVCDNNGTQVWDRRNMEQMCVRAPSPGHALSRCICNLPRISGFYCDKLACSHGGTDNGEGACDCQIWCDPARAVWQALGTRVASASRTPPGACS